MRWGRCRCLDSGEGDELRRAEGEGREPQVRRADRRAVRTGVPSMVRNAEKASQKGLKMMGLE